MKGHDEDQTETNIQGYSDPGNARGSLIKYKRDRTIGLIEAISDLFDGRAVPPSLPEGIETIERATIEAVRIKFDNEVDEKLLLWISEEEGYSVEKGSFAPRVTKKGLIIARVGSKSDAGGRNDLFIYLFPPEMDKASVYMRVLAEREGVLDPLTGKINLEKFYEFNFEVIKLVSRYTKEKYHH